MKRRDFLKGIAAAVGIVLSQESIDFVNEAVVCLEPAPQTTSLQWFCEHGTDDSGRPYDHGKYPQLGAPGGPCDAVDDPQIINIWLQFASRMGKTFFGQSTHNYLCSTNPAPAMFVSESEKLSTEVVQRTYRMFANGPLEIQLLPPRLRRQDRIDLDRCRIYVGWAKSVSTLADKPVRWGHANEIDKWVHESTSREADPLELFADRGKEFPSRKFIYESTPAVKGHSRVESGRLRSTNCQYHVPCPHCRQYQRLKMGDGKNPGGIVWDHTETGKSDRDLAFKTARYVCEHCHKDISSDKRTDMMRLGVWCPEGCTVKSEEAYRVAESRFKQFFGAIGGDGAAVTDGYKWRGWANASWIEGTPVRDAMDAGYQLPSLYATTLTWGAIAAKFVDCKKDPERLRNFVNQWLAETWERIQNRTTWERLGERIIGEVPRLIVPAWASILSVGIDRQGDHCVYIVDAWGPEATSHTVEYGEAANLEWIRDNVLLKKYTFQDGGELTPAMTLVDSGFQPHIIHPFCIGARKLGISILPCRGSTTAMPVNFQVSKLGKDTSAPGQWLCTVDTIRTQSWIEAQLHSIVRGDPGSHSVYKGSLEQHQDMLQQLLNDAAELGLDRTNNDRESWNRINTGIPNDLRDSRRYGYIAMLIATRGVPIKPRVKGQVAVQQVQQTPRFTLPDGTPYLILER